MGSLKVLPRSRLRNAHASEQGDVWLLAKTSAKEVPVAVVGKDGGLSLHAASLRRAIRDGILDIRVMGGGPEGVAEGSESFVGIVYSEEVLDWLRKLIGGFK